MGAAGSSGAGRAPCASQGPCDVTAVCLPCPCSSGLCRPGRLRFVFTVVEASGGAPAAPRRGLCTGWLAALAEPLLQAAPRAAQASGVQASAGRASSDLHGAGWCHIRLGSIESPTAARRVR